MIYPPKGSHQVNGDGGRTFRQIEELRQQGNGKEPLRLLHPWGNPDWALLEDGRGDLPAFPLNCLNAGWQAWALETAQGSGTTAAHVMVPLLGIASGLLGVARRIEIVKSWLEPCAVWTAVIGASGTGKTPGLDATKRALVEVEILRRPLIDEAKRAHEQKADIAKIELKNWRKQVETAIKNREPHPPKPDEAYDPGPFVTPRLFVSDCTIERVAMLLEAKPNGLIYLADELSALFLNMSRYSGGTDKQFWLEAWNGKAYQQERVGRKSVLVRYLIVAIVGGLQPDKLARLFSGDLDGSYARLLFAWPEDPPYRRLTDTVGEVEPEIINAFMRLTKLSDSKDFAPAPIRMAEPARMAFEALRQRTVNAKDKLDGRERDWWCKIPSHTARLAGTLTMLDWSLTGEGEPSEIDEPHVATAIRLVDTYFWPHARAALRLIGLSPLHTDARKTLRWIKAQQRNNVALEDVRRHALNQNIDAEQTQVVIRELERRGWLRRSFITINPEGGRPAVRWDVNPQLLG